MPQPGIRRLADAEVLGGLLRDGAEPSTRSSAWTGPPSFKGLPREAARGQGSWPCAGAGVFPGCQIAVAGASTDPGSILGRQRRFLLFGPAAHFGFLSRGTGRAHTSLRSLPIAFGRSPT